MILIDGIVSSIQKYGGISVYFNELISRLSTSDSNALLLEYSDNQLCKDLNGKGAVQRVQVAPRAFERYRDIKSDANIFHSTYYRLPEKRDRQSVVTTVYDYTYEKFIKGLPRVVHSWQKNRAVQSSDIVIAISESTKKDLMHYSAIDESRIRVVYPSASDNYKVLERDERSVGDTVVFVGSRAIYKNFDLAVNAVSEIKDKTLLIVGGGGLTSSELEMLERLIPGRYRFESWLNEVDLNRVFNRAFALVYPSSYEGFGIPVVEAMKAGCPVVASNVSSIPEAAGEAAILLNDICSEGIVSALRDLESAELRSQLVDKGIKHCQTFSWDKCYQETLNIYKELGG